MNKNELAFILQEGEGLIKSIAPNEFGKVSRTRNPIILNLLQRTEYAEKLGLGISKIKTAMSLLGLPAPKFEFNQNFFVSIYDKKILFEDTSTEPLTEPLTQVFNLIKIEGKINRKMLVSKLKVSRATATRYLAKLKKLGLIIYNGSKKTGYYMLTEVGNREAKGK